MCVLIPWECEKNATIYSDLLFEAAQSHCEEAIRGPKKAVMFSLKSSDCGFHDELHLLPAAAARYMCPFYL